MEKLLAEEELYFTPATGSFDVEAIAARIATLGFSFRDPVEPNTFVVCEDDESRQKLQSRRSQEAPGELPYVLLIGVEPTEVVLYQIPGTTFDDLSREFIQWLIQQQSVQVINDFDTDLTQELYERAPDGDSAGAAPSSETPS